MYFLLFDIDGTLIHAKGAGRVAIHRAFADIFQVNECHEVEFSGRTDRGIAHNLFQLHGIDDTTENWHALNTSYLEHLAEALPEQKGHVLPGVPSLLERLVSRTDIQLGLLTGNTREGARLKLEHYELAHYFPFGGFGDDHHERNDVAHEALARLKQHAKGDIDVDRVWVIGDTPLDVQCARAIQARVVAVATGNHDREELAASRPDLLLDDLSDAAAFWDAIALSV